MGRPLELWGIVVAAALAVSACAHGGAAARTPAPHAPAAEPVERRIAQADAHLAGGIAELAAGHLRQARERFDEAVDLYLNAPGGANSDPRLAQAYRRTLEAIHLRELEALAAGDGFTEKPDEPASIDELATLDVEQAPSAQARQTAEEAVKEEASDFPVTLNDAVLSCIDLYQGRLRDWFTAALQRGGRYLQKIREVFAAEGIPRDLAYVALVESAFKANALSRAKARGFWQFIPSTGRRYGLEQNWWVDERSDPEKATHAAARYLKELHEMFGDWNLALAGYNAGELAVQRAIARYNTRDFWELSRTRGLRRETKNYVPLIHAAVVVAKAPQKYGFEIAPEAAVAFDRVGVEGAVDLRVIAECAGTTLDVVQALNPELRRLATPAGASFRLKVPSGSAGATEECLKAIPPAKRVHFRKHVVTRGQSLWAIAQRYGSSVRDIAQANGIPSRKTLAVGTELIIPVEPRVAAAVAQRTSQSRRPAAEGLVRISYRIQPGDTLAAIAQQYGTSVQSLKEWNRLRGTRIAAGDVLTIYTRQAGAPAGSP